MFRNLRLVVTCALLMASAPSMAGGLSNDVLEDKVDDFNLEWRSVRSPAELLQQNYLEYDGRSFAYYLPGRLTELAGEGETFRIHKIKYVSTYVQVVLKTEREARISLFVFDDRIFMQPFLDEVVPRVLAEVFTYGQPSGRSQFVANTASSKLHLRGCNHLPSVEQRQDYDDREQAHAEGLQDCPICFSTEVNLPVEGYRSLRLEALETARLKELAYPPVEDEALQSRLQRCGEAVLDDFPIDLKGFDYRFRVLHSEMPNAFSIPTGFVYVTDKLMAAVEDSLELALILAHEIAHCEMNRTVLEPMLTGDAQTMDQTMRTYFWSLRYRETECDVLALLTLSRRTPWAEVFTRARGGLTKLQFAGEALPIASSTYASYPSFRERLSMMDPKLFMVSDSTQVYEGIDEQGDVLVTALVLGWQKILTRRSYEEVGGGSEIGGGDSYYKRYDYYILVETTELLNKAIHKGEGKVVDHSGRKVGFNEQPLPFVIEPGESGVIMLSSQNTPVTIGELKEVKLDLSGQIDKWRLVGE